MSELLTSARVALDLITGKSRLLTGIFTGLLIGIIVGSLPLFVLFTGMAMGSVAGALTLALGVTLLCYVALLLSVHPISSPSLTEVS